MLKTISSKSHDSNYPNFILCIKYSETNYIFRVWVGKLIKDNIYDIFIVYDKAAYQGLTNSTRIEYGKINSGRFNYEPLKKDFELDVYDCKTSNDAMLKLERLLSLG